MPSQQRFEFEHDGRFTMPVPKDATMLPVRSEDRLWVERHLRHGDALDGYTSWPTPATIISDGAYGVGGFPGDPRTPDGLAD